MITAVDCTIVRFKRNEVIPEFFSYYSQSQEYLSAVEAECTGTTRKRISRSKLGQISILVPPLPEQKRIVSILDEAFASIATVKANAEKSLENACALFESHLNAVFTYRDEEGAEKRLDDVCTFSSGGTPSKNNNSYWNGNIPWISGRDMKSTRLSDAALHISQKAVDESSTRMASTGSLLILVRGMGLAHGAQIAELIVPCAFNQDIRAIHAKNGIVPRYLLFALRTRINCRENVMSNAAHGTMKIDMDELKKVLVPIPAVNRQHEVVDQIDSLSAETRRLASIYERKLVELDALKKSLLHHAFTGQL